MWHLLLFYSPHYVLFLWLLSCVVINRFSTISKMGNVNVFQTLCCKSFTCMKIIKKGKNKIRSVWGLLINKQETWMSKAEVLTLMFCIYGSDSCSLEDIYICSEFWIISSWNYEIMTSAHVLFGPKEIPYWVE